ncbi:putative RNA-directed DNA polymerase [Tanacetum coccineum]
MAASMESANVFAEVKETLKVGNSIGFDMDDAGDGFTAIIGNWRDVLGDFIMVNIYAPQNGHDKSKLWSDLLHLKNSKLGFWICFGDFNVVREESERKGTEFDPNTTYSFNKFIDDAELQEVVMGARNFTRINKKGTKLSKLDRFLISTEVLQTWPTIHCTALPCKFSDHCPILMESNSADFDPVPFKFFNSWLNEDSINLHKSVQESAHLTKHLEELDLKAEIGVLSESDCNLRFTENIPRRPRFHSNKFKKISELQKCFLERPFEYDEIKNAVWSCGEDAVFLKDLLNMMKLRMRSGAVEKTRRLVLMDSLSVSNPLLPQDFRPICLVGWCYKVLSKLLANRLESVMSTIISNVQTAFLKDPFDSINWNFIHDIMGQMGFGVKWRDWIFGCLRSGYSSILINGSPSKEFKFSKGLRQGDPLSPFLFIIAMEALHIALMEAREKGRSFKALHVEKFMAEISHLQYADDALLVGEWSEINITNLIRILRCFQVSSGLKVNLNKSRLMGVGVKNDEVKRVARSIKCKNGSLPFIYLGLPVGSSMRKITSWEPIVSKLHLKLAKWKAKSLSFGGRLTLIKAVMSNLPTYYFSIYKAPNSVINRLEQIRRKFFWHGGVEEKKVSWVAWSKVAAPVKSGGLGIGSLKAFNLSNLSKWLWRWHTDKEALWYHTLHSIHGPSGGDFLKYTSIATKGSWYDILKACHDVNSLNIPIPSFFTRSIGEGVSVKFWDEVWLGTFKLADVYPRLYALESMKDCNVSDRLLKLSGHLSTAWKLAARSIVMVEKKRKWKVWLVYLREWS